MNVNFVRLSSASIVAASAVVLVGCGGDEPNINSSNRGANDGNGETTIENAFIAPAYTLSCVLQVDAPAQLSFTATNSGSLETETLLSISTPAAESVTIEAPDGALEIKPKQSIAAGQPVENVGDPAGPDLPFFAVMRGLSEEIQPGKSVSVTFSFDRGGDLTFNVPVDACPTQGN